MQEKLRLDVLDGGPVEGLVGFFDVQFRGSPQNPADFPVTALITLCLRRISSSSIQSIKTFAYSSTSMRVKMDTWP